MKIETEIESRYPNGARRAAPSGTPTRALVVEDEESMCGLIKEALGAANIEAVTLTPKRRGRWPSSRKRSSM